MPGRWLILADDLTGAGDCAVSFRRAGLEASVRWGDGHGLRHGGTPAAGASTGVPAEHGAPHDGAAGGAVLAVNVDSRAMPAADAAAAHRVALERSFRSGHGLIKKIDSTLRGQPVAELAETMRFLRENGGPGMAIVAPAFPATGRTTRGGQVLLGGVPLEHSPLWARDHTYETADLVALLNAEGLPARLLPIEEQRRGGEAIAAALDAARRDGLAAMVCDAETEEDLRQLARASLPLAGDVFWVGSGGIAAALAAAGKNGFADAVPTGKIFTADAPPAGAAPVADAPRGGVLLVVGSVAEASRNSAAALISTGRARPVSVAAAVLDAGATDPRWQHVSRDIAEALGAGQDVLVEITADPAADLRRGAALAARLAELVQPAAGRLRGLFVTGGETACALLGALGVHGIRMLDEVEAGVPLGITEGALRVHVVTKAGAFGDQGTLERSLDHLHKVAGREDEES